MKKLLLLTVMFYIITGTATAQIQDDFANIKATYGNDLFDDYKPQYFLLQPKREFQANTPFRDKLSFVKFQVSQRLQTVTSNVLGHWLDRMFNWTDTANKLGNIYFGFTFKGYWAVSEISAPFKEINFQPDLFYRHDKLNFQVGYEHESNGQPVAGTRSVNRLYGQIGYPLIEDPEEWNKRVRFRATFKIWDSQKDQENPDIDEFMGIMQFKFRLIAHPIDISFSAMTNKRLKEGNQVIDIFTQFLWYNKEKGLHFTDINVTRPYIRIFRGNSDRMGLHNIFTDTYISFGLYLFPK